jgi:hypothetical protein
MEGFDSLRVKKNIKLPAAAETWLSAARTKNLLWKRFRIPLKKFILNYKTLYYFKLIQNWTKNEPKTRQNKRNSTQRICLRFCWCI